MTAILGARPGQPAPPQRPAGVPPPPPPRPNQPPVRPAKGTLLMRTQTRGGDGRPSNPDSMPVPQKPTPGPSKAYALFVVGCLVMLSAGLTLLRMAS